MFDHDFEKKVQHKLDELKFTPSDAVWSRVESNLRGEKTRRRGWFWVPLLVGVLATGGYFLRPGYNMEGSSQKTVSDNQVFEKNKIDPQSGNVNINGSSGTDAVSDADNNSTVNDNKSVIAKEEQSLTNEGTVSTYQDIKKKSDLQNTNAAGNNTTASADTNKPSSRSIVDPSIAQNRPTRFQSRGEKQSDIYQKPLRSLTDPVNDGIINDQAALKPVIPKNDTTRKDMATDVKANDVALTESVADQNLPDSIGGDHTAGIQEMQKSEKQLSAHQDSVLAAPIRLKGLNRKGKWQFGLTLSGGVSRLSEGSLTDLLKNANVADVASMDRQASNNFLFLPTTAGVPRPKPSPVEPGFAFSIGGYVGRKITKRISFTIGLGYMQYNNSIKIGYRVDSSMLVNNVNQVANVSRYYRADQKAKYTNRYHFLEIPLQFQTRINKGVKTPLTWNAGISLSQMFASRALLFDSGTGVYYEDNSRYNRTQFAVNTGFSIGVLSGSKFPLIIGPSIRYHITPLYKENIGSRKHLLSASFDLRLPLNKK